MCSIIRIPRERMIGYGIASSLVHEVGHQGAALLRLVESLQAQLRAIRQRTRLRAAWELWDRWISEIVADFWTIAQVGIGSTLGLIGLVSLPRGFVFRPSDDDPHPMPWVRVLLSCAIGDRLYPDPQWRRLAATWRARLRSACAATTSSRASAATSSACCCRTSPSRAKPPRSRRSWCTSWPSRTTASASTSSPPARASASPACRTTATTSATLLRLADAAMYRAKDAGPQRLPVLLGAAQPGRGAQPPLSPRSCAPASSRGELFLVYQPRIDIATRRVVGAEALLRWRHPRYGVLTPEAFLPLADDTGLLVPIGAWVLREACVQAPALDRLRHQAAAA